MADLQVQEFKLPVSVTISGGFRRAAISVEAMGIALREKDSKFVGAKQVPLADPIEVVMTFKGPQGVDYKLEIEINKIKKTNEGNLSQGGVSIERCSFTFADFGLIVNPTNPTLLII